MGILLPSFFVVEKELVDRHVDENRDRHQDWALWPFHITTRGVTQSASLYGCSKGGRTLLLISSHVFSPVSEEPDEMRSHHLSPRKYGETGRGRTVENLPEGPGFGLAGLDHMGTYALQLQSLPCCIKLRVIWKLGERLTPLNWSVKNIWWMCSGGYMNQNLSNPIASLYKHIYVGKYQRNYLSLRFFFIWILHFDLHWTYVLFLVWFGFVFLDTKPCTGCGLVMLIAHDVPDSLDFWLLGFQVCATHGE